MHRFIYHLIDRSIVLTVASISEKHVAQVEEYLATFTGTNEQILFLSKSLYAIDTDKKEAKGEKVKLSKGLLCVSSRMTVFTKGSIFNKSLSVRLHFPLPLHSKRYILYVYTC